LFHWAKKNAGGMGDRHLISKHKLKGVGGGKRDVNAVRQDTICTSKDWEGKLGQEKLDSSMRGKKKRGIGGSKVERKG